MRNLFLILLLTPIISFSQFIDDFGDGDFTSNPQWFGDTANFIVNENFELQLYDTAKVGPSYLVTENEGVVAASWEFLVRFGFEPSSANYANVFLSSDNDNLIGNLNGYFVKIGDISRDISLFRKDGANTEKIIDGTDDRVRSGNVKVRILVTRDISGNWELYSDTLGGRNYYHEGSAFDNTYTSSSYFGVYCVYSATRWNLFYFDDFIVTDNNVLPEIISYELIDANSLSISFSKPINEITGLNPLHYNISPGPGNPANVSFNNITNTEILLEFEEDFENGNTYTLFYNNIEDFYGNIIESGSIEFLYFVPEFGMIVINEIMRDATPAVGLPASNYFELYNTTDFEIDITNWVYRIGTFSRTFPAHTMQPGEYLVMCEDEFVHEFEELFAQQQLDKAVAMSFAPQTFPAMNNVGQIITIFDDNQNPIDSIRYSETWYNPSWKRNGGWSLEKIDPLNLCSTFENWVASESPLGGTPGGLNSVDAPNIDTLPPFIEQVFPSAGNEITIVYSQYILPEHAFNQSNYELIPDYGHPISITVDSNNPLAYKLQFPSSLTPNIEYAISVKNIRDYCQNLMPDTLISFIVFHPSEYDVLITEIMANPSPPVQLPDAEYVELYNRTEHDLNLLGWKFSTATTVRELPYGVIEAGSYVILCHENSVDKFKEYGNVIGVAGFPSLAITGTTLSLQFRNGNYLHTVSYSNNWFKEDFKRSGGWSLEMIDINNPCGEKNNWQGSVDMRGGTPGSENSVKGESPDLERPYPIAAEAIAPDTLIVWFNEILRKEPASDPLNYSVEEFGNPVWVSSLAPRFSEITMKFDGEFETGKVYYLNIHEEIKDCSGNNVAPNTSIRFGIGDSVVKNDIVVNEILFNTRYTGGSRYIELYNNSEKLIDLKKLWISNRNSAGEIVNSRSIGDKSRLLLPGEYCALTLNNQDIKNNYFVKDPDALYELTAFPSMRNSDGIIVISDRYLNIIDEVSYDEKQHYKLLSDVAGVSLERLNYDRPSSDPNNWFSAAQDAGFGTPGYKNSQFVDNIETKNVISVYPEVFSPDNDGYNDILNIKYQFDEPGYNITIAIYSANGRLVKYVARNELVGTEGYFYWDGFDSNDNLCPIGIYIVYVEMFSLSGKQMAEKHAVVLSKRVY